MPMGTYYVNDEDSACRIDDNRDGTLTLEVRGDPEDMEYHEVKRLHRWLGDWLRNNQCME
jgi:hypothetical protein